MNARRAVLIERLILLAGLVAMALAVALVDWRIGLFFGGALAVASSVDLPWRRS